MKIELESLENAGAQAVAVPVAEPTNESVEARVEAAVAASPTVQDRIASVSADIAAKIANVQEANAVEQAENATSTIHKKDVARMVPEAMSPEMLAYTNSTIRAAISDAISGVLSQVLPPIISELKKPSEKDRLAMEERAAFLERMRREKAQGFEQDKINRANLKAQQEACQHLDKNNNESIALSHNYPDRLPRGICVQCRQMIEPKHYELAVPGLNNLIQAEEYLAKCGYVSWTPFVNPKTGIVTHFLVPEHPLYHRVRRIEAMQS
jgi:hypothetical protein